MLAEGIFDRARRVVGDDSDRALFGDRGSKMVGIIGGVSHDEVGGQVFDERTGLWRIAFLACSQSEPGRVTQASDGEIDFRAEIAARSANGGIVRPPFFAPAACR